MGQVKQLDERMNAAGLLRLMTAEPLAMNMSNTLRGVQAARAGQTRLDSRRHSQESAARCWISRRSKRRCWVCMMRSSAGIMTAESVKRG